jgi:hypothetical protein
MDHEKSQPSGEEVLTTNASAEVDEDIADVKVHISTEQKSTGPMFEHSNTLRDLDEIVSIDEPPISKEPERCGSARSLADCISTNEEEEWSALEGVTRVNSLLKLPRLLSGDKRSASWRKRP